LNDINFYKWGVFSDGMDAKEAIGIFEETAEFQSKYKSLLSACDAEGVMIFQDRLLEEDKDISPYHFFRKGTREYVFPRQRVSLTEDNSSIVDSNTEYGLRTEKQAFNFDQDLVEGRIMIEYEDAGNRPILKVIDVLGGSKIPEAVGKTLDDVF
jgi:hypothetical protein